MCMTIGPDVQIEAGVVRCVPRDDRGVLAFKGSGRQSGADRDHPMIATPGHIALIVPGFAQSLVGARELGVYEYLGGHRWQCYDGKATDRFFYIGIWG